MLHVGLLILKIIGFVLLGILCLLVGLLLIVLLVPIRYRMDGSFHGSPQGMARITWLLHILSVKVSYDKDGELLTSVRLFGFRLFQNRTDGEEVLEEGLDDADDAVESVARGVEEQGAREVGRKVQEDPLMKQGLDSEEAWDSKEEFEEEFQEDLEDGSEDDSDLILQTQELRSESFTAGPDGDRTPPADEAPRREGRFSRFARRIGRRVTRFLEKIKFYFHTLCDKLKHIKDNYDEVLTFVKDGENQKTMKLILKQAKFLFRHILPRKASGYVTFGFDDPYTTGQVLAAASLFYAWYGQKIDLIPVFEEPALEGELKLKGRLRMGTILWCGLRVFFNKNFRLLLKRWRSR